MNALNLFPEYQGKTSPHCKRKDSAQRLEGVQGVQEIMRCMPDSLHNGECRVQFTPFIPDRGAA